MEKFLVLNQEGTVREYQKMFKMMAAPLPTVPESVMEGNFINGLGPEIRAELRMVRPQDLGQIMELAQRVEIETSH